MSYDLKLTTACNHMVYRELTPMEGRRILRLDKLLAITATVKVYASDNLVSPNFYKFIDDPLQVDIQKNKVIYFNDPWKSPDDNFEVTYQTNASYCAKCVGSNYLDDISYDIRGSFAVLRDEYLLMQNVEKFVITQVNSNPFHTAIGTGLTSLIGTRVSNAQFLTSQISSEISKTLQIFQDLQSQYRMTGRTMTAGETMRSVDSIKVEQDVDDPTVWKATVGIIAESGKTVQFEQLLKIRA